MDKQELFEKMKNAVVEGDKGAAMESAHQVLEQRIKPREAIENGFTPGITEMGELWEEGEVFLPELVLSAEAMKAGIEILKPEMEKRNETAPTLGTVVIGTIEGDIHDIGKSLVASLLAAAGFNVIDLGVDVPVDKFIDEAKSNNADFIGVSALLTTTMAGQKKVIEKLKAEGMRDQVKVLVGGAPVSKKWASEIGADASPTGAMEAVQTARKMAKEAKV